MTIYLTKKLTKPDRNEQVFGERNFFVRSCEEGVCGELIKYRNAYFARIGNAMHRATLIQYDDGKRWSIEPNPS